ncbi:hypothetical protein CF58_30960 [Escherichia coli]|nr:hypothetical protein CF58_30960 [Escherichia coli]
MVDFPEQRKRGVVYRCATGNTSAGDSHTCENDIPMKSGMFVRESVAPSASDIGLQMAVDNQSTASVFQHQTIKIIGPEFPVQQCPGQKTQAMIMRENNGNAFLRAF